MREVMEILRALGMVSARRRFGHVIQPKNTWNVLDPAVFGWLYRSPDKKRVLEQLAQFRAAAEPEAAELAARKATAEQRQRFAEIAEKLRQHELRGRYADPAALQRDLADFHVLELQASGNEFFRHIADLVRTAIVTLQTEFGPDLIRLVDSDQWLESQIKTAAAIAAGDHQSARAESAKHTVTVFDMVELLQDRGSGKPSR